MANYRNANNDVNHYAIEDDDSNVNNEAGKAIMVPVLIKMLKLMRIMKKKH